MTDVRARKPAAWYALAVVASVLAAGGIFDAVRGLRQGDPWWLLSMPVGLLFWYWVGVGSWRRAKLHSSPEDE